MRSEIAEGETLQKRVPQVMQQLDMLNGIACDIATQVDLLISKISPILAPQLPKPLNAPETEPAEDALPPLALGMCGVGHVLRSTLRDLEATIHRVEV